MNAFKIKVSVRTFLGFLFFSGLLVGNAAFLKYNAFQCFNFWDMSAFLDASYRVFKGQIPFKDFYYTTGPVHLYLNALFFWIFGFGKTAILVHLIFVSSVVTGVIFGITRNSIPLLISLLVSALTAVAFYWPVSHPWYDQSAHFFCVLVLGWLVVSLPFKNRRLAIMNGFFSGFMVALCFLTKTNVGFAYAALFLLIFLISNYRGSSLTAYLVGGIIAASAVFFALGGYQNYLEQSYSFAQSKYLRFKAFGVVKNWFANYYWIFAVLSLINIWPGIKKCREIFALAFGMPLVGIFCIHTGTMLHVANMPLWGICLALNFILIYRLKDYSNSLAYKIWHWTQVVAAVMITALLLAQAVKYGIDIKVWSYIKEPPRGNYALKSAPMQGWLCERFPGSTLDEIVVYVKENISSAESFLILGDITILYALTNRDSYRGVPFMFKTDDLPVKIKQCDEVREKILQDPPDWILWNRLGPTFGRELLDYMGLTDTISTKYFPVQMWSPYILFYRRR